MDDSTLLALKSIGIPVAIIAAVFVTWLFTLLDKRLSLASGIVTLLAIVAYIPIELWPKAKDAISEVSLEVLPASFYAINNEGKPIIISASCKRGREVVDHFVSKDIDVINWKERQLELKPHDTEQAFYISLNGLNLGKVSDQALNNVGYSRKSTTEPCSKPYFLASSKKVYLNSLWPIGNTETAIGKLTLEFKSIEAGKAIVSLSSSQLPLPKPERLAIRNKSFDTQTFESTYEVTVQVREANFEVEGKEWAAFNIIVFD